MPLNAWAHRALRRLATYLGVWIFQVQSGVAQRTLPKFANNPKHLIIDLPRRIINPECIFIGDHVWLGPGSFISAVSHYPSASLRHPEKENTIQRFHPVIRIGNRVTSSGNLIVGAVAEIEIEDDVLLSFNVTILDNLHGYENADEPYKYQPLQRIAPVAIKKGCWIGQNAVILPGVTIGAMSIVGANSVVTQTVPDRCIAVGAPAQVIKRWSEEARQWISCPPPKRPEASIGGKTRRVK
ncbi:MAG: acyltransferase [Candidatus Binatia bacterium]